MGEKNYDSIPFSRREKNVNVQRAFRYWQKMLFARLMRIFIWEGLPFPQRELEFRLLKSGAVSIVDDPKWGLTCVWASLSGVTPYADVFTDITYGAPKTKGGTVKVGEKGIYGYNTSTQLALTGHVDYYASLLAHTYMSIKMALVNLRAQDVFSATDDATKRSIEEWHRGLYDGKMLAIFDDSLSELPTTIQQLSGNNRWVDITKLMEVHNDLLRNFYRDIGIRYSKEKKGNLVSDEVTSDEQMLLYNVEDMSFCRQQLRDDYNSTFAGVYDKPVSVKLNPIFEVIASNKNEEVKDDN